MLKKLKTALLLGVMMYATNFFSQEKQVIDEAITASEVQTFIKIYEYKLNHPFEIAISMENASKKTTLSEERISEILQAQFAGNTIKLSEKEKTEFEKIQAFMATDKAKYDSYLNAFITENNMKPTRYKEIEDFFYNNKAFQNKIVSLYNKTN